MKGMFGRGPRTAAVMLAVTALAAVLTGAAQPVGAQTRDGTQHGSRHEHRSGPRLGTCGPGELCLWESARFKGKRRVHELSGIDIESCTALPGGASTLSAANRTGRPVTLYQSAVCAETAEFNTHPSGSWTPELPYRARAFKVWEH
ncbi:peptidase inhibitor family I36 protein [Streptomyces spirodelae]|uniref:Peptidase inhibitor family I36 protein n=1 Tax=Streptomyces spirodelae TaxID=2812904 RepID=A0ABS3WMZ0_9ACTN|nr:peptidase inhibitor family I36 protein [Streptomyces spirodelae]MBO8184490.1 peptidase inhibitor family I36 protein [Streptomyces spirodelae]